MDSVETASNAADDIFPVLQRVKADVEARGIVVVGVVGDNAQSVQNVLARYNVQQPLLNPTQMCHQD